MTSIEAICNQSLDLIGYPRHIGNIYDGSKAARIALNSWGHTRDTLLETLKPDWSYKDVRLTLLKSAPNITNGMANYVEPWNSGTNPPLPWLYEYAFPDDCITPCQIKNAPLFVPEWRPRPKTFRPLNSTSIVTNQPNAILIYISRVTNPDQWHDTFVEAMIQALARRFEGELAPQRRQQRQQQEQSQNASNNPG